MAEPEQVFSRDPRIVRIAHRHGDTRPRLGRTDPRERDPAFGQKAGDQRIFRVGRGEDNSVGLERRYGSAQLAFDMVVMRVDQLDHHAIAMLRTGQHPAEHHLVDPVAALAGLPVGNREVAVVDREDEIGTRPAHLLGRLRRHVSQLVDARLHPLLHDRADVGLVVYDAADGLQRYSGICSNVLDGDSLTAPTHIETPKGLFRPDHQQAGTLAKGCARWEAQHCRNQRLRNKAGPSLATGARLSCVVWDAPVQKLKRARKV